jgi:hypothetical protein
MCSELAEHLKEIEDDCSYAIENKPAKPEWHLGGQVFDDRGFNVVMGYSDKCMELWSGA